MKPTPAQIQTYLRKIDVVLADPIIPDFETLQKVVEGHIFTFPYEDINVHDADLHSTHRTTLRFNTLFRNLVENNRGGHCVQINVLLQTMLSAMGFTLMPILPESLWHTLHLEKGKRNKHCAAIVTIADRDYLVDAGMGGLGLLSPMRLQTGIVQQYSEKYRLINSTDYQYELQIRRDNQWVSIYGFAQQAASKKDYLKTNRISQNALNPHSAIKDIFLCTKPFKIGMQHSGRYRLCDKDFFIFKNGKQTYHKKIENQQQVQKLLRQYFNIDISDHRIQYREFDRKAYETLGVTRPPIVFQYPRTRLQKNYVKLATECGEKVRRIARP